MRRFGGILAKAFSLDLRALALARIATGLILFYEFLYALRYWDLFFSDSSMLPRIFWARAASSPEKWSLFLLSSQPGFDYFFLLGGLGASVALFLGYRAKVAAAVAWILYLSLQQRNPFILIGGDVWLSSLVFWMMFLPISDFYTVERRPKQSQTFLFSSAATAGLVLQTALIYFVSGWTKTGQTWSNGTAVELTLSTRFGTELGRYLLHTPDLLKLVTPMIPRFEVLAALVLLCPWQRRTLHSVLVPALLFMHLVFQVSLDLHHFSVVAMANLLCFLPSNFWKEQRNPTLMTVAPKGLQAGLLVLAVLPLLWQPFRERTEELPTGVTTWARFLGVDRDWSLFSPDPPMGFDTIAVSAELTDGSVIFLDFSGEPMDAVTDSLGCDVRLQYWMEAVLFNPKHSQLRRSYSLWLGRRVRERLPKGRAPKFVFLSQRHYESVSKPPDEPVLFHQELVRRNES